MVSHSEGPTPCNMLSCFVIFQHMDKQTISFRIDSEKVRSLDRLTEILDRDRSYLMNEAITAYLDVQQWHVDQITAGVRQADAGKLIDHDQVRTLAKKMTTKRRSR